MQRRLALRLGAALIAGGILLPAYARTTSSAAAGAAQASTITFHTQLTGPTADGKHTVSLDVSQNSILDKKVKLRIDVFSGSLMHGFAGSSYSFSLPAGDLLVRGGSATLDTHNDLGAYGRVTAQWSYTVVPPRAGATNPCTGSADASGSHLIVSGHAMLALTFPCDGAVNATLSGSNIDVDTGTLSAQSRSAMGLLQSVYFTALNASKTTATGSLDVAAYQFGPGQAEILASVTASNKTGAALTDATHYASDQLPAGALAIGKPTSTLRYKGNLGSATLTVTANGQSYNTSLSAECYSGKASDRNTRVSLASQSGSVRGTASLRACTAITATFGAGDTGIVLATNKGTGAGGVGSGPSISSGSFSVVKTTPSDGATGVPTSGPISVTLSGAPKDGRVNIILIPSGNSSGAVFVQGGTYNSGNRTFTAPLSSPLAANTKYRMTVVAQGAAGGFASVTINFTTGG